MTVDPEERKKLFTELQRYLMDDKNLPAAPTARDIVWFAADEKVRGWTAPSYFASNYTWQFDRVWLQK